MMMVASRHKHLVEDKEARDAIIDKWETFNEKSERKNKELFEKYDSLVDNLQEVIKSKENIIGSLLSSSPN